MSSTSSTSSTTDVGSSYYGLTAAKDKTQLTMSSFLQLLTTQLQYQDPTAPMSSSDMFAQIAQLGTVQGMDTLTKDSAFSQAEGLIGMKVTATVPVTGSTTSNSVTGTVTGMYVKSGTYYLNVTDSTGNITSVTTSQITNISTPTSSTTG